MILILRVVNGLLWRFTWFRVCVIELGLRGWCTWFVRNTPLVYSLRLKMLEVGELGLASEAREILAEWGEL